MAASALAGGGWLALHHPLWPTLASALFAAWVVLVAWRPVLWLLVLPATLPLLNFSPWTGWIVFEELDLLVLGSLAGGYLSRTFDAPQRHPMAARGAPRWPILALLLAGLGLVGLVRGFADAGSQIGWFQGYAEPLNTLRVFKPLAYALLLWPLLDRQVQASTSHTLRHFVTGNLLGLGVVSLAVLWERAAFPGVLDFSAPYRSTALFWEMHVGGAAIDAYLSMTLPFVAWALWTVRSPAHWLGAAALALLAAYAALMTFSRGVYLAALGPLLLLGLDLLARRVGFHAQDVLRRALVYLLLGCACAALLLLTLAVFGLAGLLTASAALLVLALALGWRLVGWRRAAGLGLALALLFEAVLVFGTGHFMGSRLDASKRDFGSRLEHWRNGLGLLHTPADALVGIGLGRLPAHYARYVPEREFSGAIKEVDAPPGHQAVRLAGPLTQRTLGGQFSLTQRISLGPEAAYRVAFDVRVLSPTDLDLSVCEIHLIFDGRCQTANLRLRPGDTAWQRHELALTGPPLPQRSVPRLRSFALSVTSTGNQIEIDNLSLTGAGAGNLLRNGDFSRGLASWLPAAQGYVLPWHIDNLYLELLIERGLAGLAASLALLGLALWNLLAGPARQQPIAPFLAASLCGGLVIGLASSVMDMPRVALLFWLLPMLALSLGGADQATSADGRTS